MTKRRKKPENETPGSPSASPRATSSADDFVLDFWPIALRGNTFLSLKPPVCHNL